MLYRSLPRSRSARVIGNGNRFERTPFSVPEYISSSIRKSSRATVPGTGGRSERPSAKNLLGQSGKYFGWICISSRQPESIRASPARQPAICRRLRAISERPSNPPKQKSVLNLIDSMRLQLFQKRFRPRQIEVLVARLDAQEKLVRGREREAVHVEYRVIGPRQTVQGQHAHHRRNRPTQNRQFKRDGNPGRPAIKGLAANVERETDHVGVPAHEKSGAAAQKSADEGDDRQGGPIKTDRFRQPLHRNGSEGIDALIPRLARAVRRGQHFLRRLELSHQSVQLVVAHRPNAAPEPAFRASTAHNRTIHVRRYPRIAGFGFRTRAR